MKNGNRHMRLPAACALLILLSASAGRPQEPEAPAFWATITGKTPSERRQALAKALSTPEGAADAGTIHVVAGRLLEMDGNTASAVREYSDPSTAGSDLREYALFWKAGILEKQGRSAEAASLWQALFEIPQEPSFKLEAAATLYGAALKRRDKAAAVPYAEALFAAAPEDPELAASLAGLYEDTGKREFAEPIVRALWCSYPSRAESLAFFKARPQWAPFLASLPNPAKLERLRGLSTSGDVTSLIREVPSFKPSTPQETGWLTFFSARILEGKKRYREALTAYRAVKDPEDAAAAAGERSGLMLPYAAFPSKLTLEVESEVLRLPPACPGRERALLALIRWRDRAGLENRACELAAGLLSSKGPQVTAAEYIYKRAWERWMTGRRTEGEKLFRSLASGLPPGVDDRLAASYSLLRLGRLTEEEAAKAREEILKEDRYGYFGYRLRKALPKPDGVALPPLSEAPGAAGSHSAKARKLLLVGFPAEAAGEYRMAGDASKDPRLDWALARAQTASQDYAGAIRTVRRIYPRAFAHTGDNLPEQAWRTLFPAPYQEPVKASAQLSGLPLLFVFSVIRQESLWDAAARSRSGALGLMQLMPGTASMVARKIGMPPPNSTRYFEPEWNTQAGCAYLSDMMRRYSGRYHLALAAYNAGPGRVDDWLRRPGCPPDEDLFVESIPFRETRSYVRRISLNYWEYGRLYPELKAGTIPALEFPPPAP